MEDRTVEVRCLELFFARRTRPLLNRTIVHTGGGCFAHSSRKMGSVEGCKSPMPREWKNYWVF